MSTSIPKSFWLSVIVKSEVLRLGYISLSEENTRGLVTAMRTRVQRVDLYEGVTLDPALLAAYDGQGHCTKLVVWNLLLARNGTMTRYRKRLKKWAADRGWTVIEHYGNYGNNYALVLMRTYER